MKIRLLLFMVVVSVCSCKDSPRQNQGPIVLGDPSTIITETDSQYLANFVTDLKLPEPATEPAAKDSAVADSIAPAQQLTAPPPSAQGLTVAFKEVTIFIPDISVRTFKEQDLSKASGASYMITEGKLEGNEMNLSGATIQKVYQRYQTAIIAKNNLGTLELDNLDYNSDWKPVKLSNNSFKIQGLNNLQHSRASSSQIRSAVSRAARNSRLSRSKIRQWESAVRNVRSVTQAPLSIKLRSVMWKIEGKDASGRHFQKQLRIDLPI